MNDQFEYYRPHRINDNSIPLLDEEEDCPEYLYMEHFIMDPKLMLFTLGDPIPRKPKMADYLFSGDSVISKKIFDVLEPLKVDGIQLLPAIIRRKKQEDVNDYWAIHIYNSINCVDPSLSNCVIDGTTLTRVKNIVLNKNILQKIPLKKRLIFRLREDWAYQLFHISIVEKVMSVNPLGVRFTNIEKWNRGTLFED